MASTTRVHICFLNEKHVLMELTHNAQMHIMLSNLTSWINSDHKSHPLVHVQQYTHSADEGFKSADLGSGGP